MLNGRSSIAPWLSDIATSSPNDAALASSEEGEEEASECMTKEVAMIVSSQDNASLLASLCLLFLKSIVTLLKLNSFSDRLHQRSRLLLMQLITRSKPFATSTTVQMLSSLLPESWRAQRRLSHWTHKWVIQQKAQYLTLALHLARENMNGWTTIGELQRQHQKAVFVNYFIWC